MNNGLRIVATSDLHGFGIEIPDCDLLILAGDYCPHRGLENELRFLNGKFKPWIDSIAARGIKVIGVAGNHDGVFQTHPELVPAMDWTYLQDSGVEWRGLKIWGTPWQPWFYDWAFNAYEPELREKWKLILDDTDILICHSPPKGYGDWSPYGNEHVGSPSLLERVLEVQPRYMFAGHLHSGYGRYQIGSTIFYNVALVDEGYRPVNPPVEINYG